MRRVYLMLLVIVLLTGCGKDNVEKNDTNTNNMKDLYIVAGNYDMKISNNAGQIGFKVNLLSKEKLSKDDLSVKLNTAAKYDYDLVELEKEEMPYYVYQCYKNVDWEKLKMLESDASTNLEFTEYQDKYVAEYNKSDKKKDFYYFEMEILFDNETITQPEELTDIQIEYKNKTFEEKLGNVNLTKFVEEPENITEKGYFSLMTGGMYNINAFPNKDGELYTPESGLKFEVYNDTVIKSIKILNNDSISVKDVVIKDATNGMDRKFDGELPLKKGDEGNICITLVDEEFKSKLCYSANMFLDIEFEAGDTTEHECIPVQFNTRLDPYEVYADAVDGVDILSFYTKYYEYNKE